MKNNLLIKIKKKIIKYWIISLIILFITYLYLIVQKKTIWIPGLMLPQESNQQKRGDYFLLLIKKGENISFLNKQNKIYLLIKNKTVSTNDFKIIKSNIIKLKIKTTDITKPINALLFKKKENLLTFFYKNLKS